MKKLYSFDIFDTCLVRTCGDSHNVFEILAEKILGKDSDNSAKIDFTLIRANAEREARNKLINSQNEEITLEEIYNFCDFKKLTPIDNNSIMEMELKVEEFVLLPVESIRKEIDLLVRKGFEVIYISDMYVALSFIKKILKLTGFYINDNVYLSSSIKKSKASGHLFDYISDLYNINNKFWVHKGDNKLADYIIPSKKGIKATIIKHEYNYYEKIGLESLKNGFCPNSNYAFSLSKAIRLSFSDTPHNIFAATFIAPMFVSYVYHILTDSMQRGINHLFFLSRDGYILYNIALEFSKQFPNIKLSYIYTSRQALYMAGLDEISPQCIKKLMPHLKQEGIEKILYELHLKSYDYSKLKLSGLNGEKIIDLLFEDKIFVKELNSKYIEQNELIIKYFKQEGLTSGHCATVDAVGSRRCQNAMNRILSRNHFPVVFSYYFEVTWNRITDYYPYYAMNYQENVFNTKYYNRASQPLYEQFFAISDQKRTIEYRDNHGIIEPIFEEDFISYDYKKHVFETNKSVCISYAKHFLCGSNYSAILNIQASQRAFTAFCYAPLFKFLKAIESFRCTGSGEANEVLLNKRSLLYVIKHIDEFFRWPEGQLIYSSGCLYPLILYYLQYRHRRK